MSNNDKREWRKILRSMPREVQDAIDAHAQLHQPDGEVTVAKPRPGSSSYGWWLVELLPEQRAVLFRPDDSVLRWVEGKKPSQKEARAVFECLDQTVVPTKEQLDQLLAVIRLGNAAPAEMRQ